MKVDPMFKTHLFSATIEVWNLYQTLVIYPYGIEKWKNVQLTFPVVSAIWYLNLSRSSLHVVVANQSILNLQKKKYFKITRIYTMQWKLTFNIFLIFCFSLSSFSLNIIMINYFSHMIYHSINYPILHLHIILWLLFCLSKRMKIILPLSISDALHWNQFLHSNYARWSIIIYQYHDSSWNLLGWPAI